METYFTMKIVTFILCSSLWTSGYSCMFEEGCEGWKMPPMSTGKPGFKNMTAAELNSQGLPGPRHDHSKNSLKGYFAIAGGELLNSQALLVSPWYGASGPQCGVKFHLQMAGQDPGSLKVMIKTENFTQEIHTIYGDQGNKWSQKELDIGELMEPFQIIFKAERGNGERAYIAIDTVTLPNCDPDKPARDTCSLNEYMCSNSVCRNRDHVCDFSKDCLYSDDEQNCDDVKPAHARCNFEQDMCGWKNLEIDNFDWTRHNGSTPSENTGPSYDNTLGNEGNKTGYFIYIEASDKGVGDSAIIESPPYPPPPSVVYNASSPYNNTCKVRFFYHMYGMNTGGLELYVVPRGEDRQMIWREFGKNINLWIHVAVPIPNISDVYTLQFRATCGFRFRGDIAIDDISLSPECLGLGLLKNKKGPQYSNRIPWDMIPGIDTTTPIHTTQTETPYDILPQKNKTIYQFNTCGAYGRQGPTNKQCQNEYRNKPVNVTVLDHWRGVQVWRVPTTGIYTFEVTGARGGYGVYSYENITSHRGAGIAAKFLLQEGEKLYVLVGQRGQDACYKRTGNLVTALCNDQNKNNSFGGGGGGGGGTYIFKSQGMPRSPVPLMIAGGGGGLAYTPQALDKYVHNSRKHPGPGTNGITPITGPGAGGGWNGLLHPSLPQAGHSLLKGGLGGVSCKGSQWRTHGGFGGGGGACTAGGGGGGYSGGNVSLINEMQMSGQGGSSIIAKEGLDITDQRVIIHNSDDGSVMIELVMACDCEHGCQVTNKSTYQYRCYCPAGFQLAEDKKSCVAPAPVTSTKMPSTQVLALAMGAVAVVAVAGMFIFCFFHHRQRRQMKALHLEKKSTLTDNQLNRLRQGSVAVPTELNPNYDFGGMTTMSSQFEDLREIPRENLKLVRALGQGAFGEVYQGFLSNMLRGTQEIPVAVKTLPALSTDQAEVDFLMEALIMSKFNHPNIVRFIGVCFEKHPRFIVLELLNGGDLKTFLREARPKAGDPSSLTMTDLLKLALDIAKGCQHLEDHHFIHRDIAARNCLLTTKGHDRVAKIADFGMARDIYRADYYRKGGKAMLPVKWMPPEAFLDGIFTSKTDVWSFGILLWEVFSLGYMPYPGRGNQEVMQLVTAGGRLEPPENCPTAVYAIMTQCWHGIAERRPSFSTIIQRLLHCLEDPEVIGAKLPLFSGAAATEPDNTIMRPRDDDQMVLTVKPQSTYVEPDSPNSLQPLISPTSPDDCPAVFNSESEMSKNSRRNSFEKYLLAANKRKNNCGNTSVPKGDNCVFNYDQDSMQRQLRGVNNNNSNQIFVDAVVHSDKEASEPLLQPANNTGTSSHSTPAAHMPLKQRYSQLLINNCSQNSSMCSLDNMPNASFDSSLNLSPSPGSSNWSLCRIGDSGVMMQENPNTHQYENTESNRRSTGGHKIPESSSGKRLSLSQSNLSPDANTFHTTKPVIGRPWSHDPSVRSSDVLIAMEAEDKKKERSDSGVEMDVPGKCEPVDTVVRFGLNESTWL